MSILGTPTNIALTPTERTHRVVINTSLDNPYSVTVYRETWNMDQDNKPFGPVYSQAVYTFNFSEIANESVTVGETTLTVAQIAAFIQAYCDQKVTLVNEEPQV